MKKVWMRAALLFLAGFSSLQTPVVAEVTDRIVAIVGHDAIFKSEIDNRALMARMQYPEMANDKDLSRSILEGLIDQKIIIAKAKIDSVSVDEGAVDASVNDRFKQLSAQFSSKADMESRFGKSSAGIRESIRQEFRNQQLIETLRRKKAKGISVTYAETMAFYTSHRDQISEIPESVSVSQILKYSGVSDESKAQSLATIQKIQAELKAGADFGELAKKYSEDPGSAKLGGDLGVAPKGAFIPSFESAAFALKEGKISGVVETRYGFHLIQLLSKETNTIHVRHILIGFDRSTDGLSRVLSNLDAIRSDVLSGKATFAESAKKYSDDPVSAALGGTVLIGDSNNPLFVPSTMRPELQQIIASLKKPGDISKPQKIETPQGEPFGIIFQLNQRVPAHRLDPEKDYASLEEMALEDKSKRQFNDWVQMLRKEVYVRSLDI